MRILSAVSCTSCWAPRWAQGPAGAVARAHVPHWQRVWKHHGWFLMWDMTWCNNANSSRYSQWDSVCKYCELGQCVSPAVLCSIYGWWSSDGKNCQSECDHCDGMLHGWDDSTVHYGPVNPGADIRAQLPLISRPSPACTGSSKAQTVPGPSCVPINVHSLGCERNLTIRCNYQIWHPCPLMPCCTVLPWHAITPSVLYCTYLDHKSCSVWIMEG